jgi:hypothetical protein
MLLLCSSGVPHLTWNDTWEGALRKSLIQVRLVDFSSAAVITVSVEVGPCRPDAFAYMSRPLMSLISVGARELLSESRSRHRNRTQSWHTQPAEP